MSKLTLPKNRIASYDDSQSSALGVDAKKNFEQYQKISLHFNFPISRELLPLEFYDLMIKWKRETKFSPSVLEICTNSSYQQIIGMGEKVLPLIFEELKKGPDHWFWALKAITRIDPVNLEDRGNLRKMTQAWLLWWKENNYRY